MESVILDTSLREEIHFQGVRFRSYPKSPHLSNLVIENTDPQKQLRVLVGSLRELTERSIAKTVPAGQFVTLRKMAVGNWKIHWVHFAGRT